MDVSKNSKITPAITPGYYMADWNFMDERIELFQETALFEEKPIRIDTSFYRSIRKEFKQMFQPSYLSGLDLVNVARSQGMVFHGSRPGTGKTSMAHYLIDWALTNKQVSEIFDTVVFSQKNSRNGLSGIRNIIKWVKENREPSQKRLKIIVFIDEAYRYLTDVEAVKEFLGSHEATDVQWLLCMNKNPSTIRGGQAMFRGDRIGHQYEFKTIAFEVYHALAKRLAERIDEEYDPQTVEDIAKGAYAGQIGLTDLSLSFSELFKTPASKLNEVTPTNYNAFAATYRERAEAREDDF